MPFAADSPAGALLTATRLTKRYGATTALDGVGIELRAGEVHALVGENGAGKSTLGKLIAGLVRPDGGELSLDGRPVSFRGPGEAVAHGIVGIQQEIALVPQLTVMENVMLGRERRSRLTGLVDRVRLRREFDAVVERSGFAVRGGDRVGGLRLAEQQKVEIMRALARDARVIVMDEPTSSLGQDDAEALQGVVRQLCAGGVAVVYVSHFLREVLAVSDRITVLRNGRLVRSEPAAALTAEELVRSMTGGEQPVHERRSRHAAAAGPPRLRLDGLTRAPDFEDVSLEVAAGEVVVLAGLVGAGRTEVARAVFGAERADCGTIELDGRAVSIRSPRDAMRLGIALVPESRKTEGLVLDQSGLWNAALPVLAECTTAGLVRRRAATAKAASSLAAAGVRAERVRSPVRHLSGGNQQKVLFAKWLATAPRVLIADEPTRGVDIATKRAIQQLIVELAESGLAVLLISSELEEVLPIASRVVVMRRGRVVGEIAGSEATHDVVTRHALGEAPDTKERRA
ncbi:sugar ABC transporter ATP-binding protein [Conexibacter woesei]|nr:sugar ABC transporter ATP-binding protein [Conexibacter woesei]